MCTLLRTRVGEHGRGRCTPTRCDTAPVHRALSTEDRACVRRKFMGLLRTMEERALIEYGPDGDELDKLLSSYAELHDDWPELFGCMGFRFRVRARLHPREQEEEDAEEAVEVTLSVHAHLTAQ